MKMTDNKKKTISVIEMVFFSTKTLKLMLPEFLL